MIQFDLCSLLNRVGEDCNPEDYWLCTLTLPETNIAPENGWLEDEFPFGMAQFQWRTVSFREDRDYEMAYDGNPVLNRLVEN